MTGIYLVELADWLRAVGLNVVEYDGWQSRARSSGGFPFMPWGCQWHHTAGSGSNPQGDCDYMWRNASDRPIGNVYLALDGTVWVGAAGAANTAGKGGPWTGSRGTVPVDGANSRTFAVEAANNGVGQAWPQVQIDAYYVMSNELNRRFGNQPGDLFTHAQWAPTRKIDPATATAVQGPWKPRSINSSGTWNVDDIKSEAGRRAGTPTPPTPNPDDLTEEEVDEILAAIAAMQKDIDGLVANEANRYADLYKRTDRNNNNINALATNEANRYAQYVGWHNQTMAALNPAAPTATAIATVEPADNDLPPAE